MQGALLIVVLFLGFGFSSESCPKYILCVTSEKQNSCPSGKFHKEKVKVHGCCSGCVILKDEGQPCKVPEDCQPGFTCDSSKKCVEDPLQACEFYKRSDPFLKKTKYWSPLCLPDGTFAPKQCKGERMAGKCFCVSKMGERIFGEEEWSKADNMTCACSRLAEELKRTGAEVDLHCDRQGNFEPLQCDRKVCWCASPSTGTPYTVAVPFEMMIGLNCYNRDAVGAQYFRQCDSTNHMQEVAKTLLRNHGTTGVMLTSQKCNFDGSFHRVQVFRNKKRCVFINNSPLTEALESKNVTCNCAYDKYVAQLRQTDFLFDCLPNGNYSKRQIWNEKVFCVDEDGFLYSSDPADCPVTG